MDQARLTPSGERHSLVPNGAAAPGSRRASLAVPLLDEESLKANNGLPNVSAAGGFTLVSQNEDSFKSNGNNANLPTPSMGNMNNNSSSGSNNNNNGLGSEGMPMSQSPSQLSKNLDHNQIYSMLQQQQAVAMAAAQLEQSYNQTCYLLQQCSHNALLTILMSLLNDYPTTLVQPIRVRVEQVLAQQMSPTAGGRPSGGSARKPPGSTFVPNSSAAPWTPSNMHGGSAAPTPTANGTPGGAHRRGRGHKGKEEEQEMCSLHNNMRAMKHLQLNQSTGLYECIHGFHCLVDGPADLSPKRAAAATPSVSNSASRGSNPPPSADSQPFVPAALQQQQQQQQFQQVKAESRFSATEVEALRMLGYSLGNNNNNNNNNGSNAGQMAPRRDGGVHRDPELATGGGYTVVGDDRGGSTGTSPIDARLNMDIPSLEYLLQSVRDIDDD